MWERFVKSSLVIVCFLFINLELFAEEKIKIVTTFTIIADITKNITGDAAEVLSITKPGAEIHGYQPTPKDIVKAYDADLILWNGMNLELWFEQFFSNLNETTSITVSEGIDAINISEGDYQGLPNPHAWMGLNEALIYVDNIVNALSYYDKKNSELYFQNAAKYKEKIISTIEPLKESILQLPEKQRWLVTCEGAFSYLARDLSLKELFIWPMNADEVGTPKQIKKVIDRINENKIPIIFCESTVNQAPAKQIAKETGAKFGGILYVDSLSDKNGPVPTYLDLLKSTYNTVEKGLVLEN
ncbi:MAG: iron ABC transporter substrate-binding protein [Rhodobacterales bacterium]|jgi:manganese/iron transport system substrate-binding protein|nr:MAG: iron ABC transporter substrate-binding protein [Rhodobacterales bacterium]|tara:strand:- start:1923 stop:2822 length:900 start_codon:yes stop_codon:yes gene_type:complete